MIKLINSPRYIKERNNAVRYINDVLERPRAASKLMDEIEAVLKRIKDNPRRYSPVPRQPDMDLRHAPVNNYVAVYKIEGDEVILTHFFHSRQNWL